MAAESSGDESEAAEEEERLNNFRDFVIYNTMVGRLCIDHDNGEEEEDEDDDNRPMLLIPDSEYARVMLQNIDSFCQLLASITYLHWVHSSSPAKVGINEGNVASWNKLFSALGGLEYIDNLQIQGTNFSPEIVVRTIQAAQSLGVGAPDTTMCVLQMSSVKDLVPLVEAVHVSALGCEHIHLEFLGKLRPGDDEGIMFQLIRDYHWMSLRLYRIDFTHDESKALGRMLSTDCVSTNCFSIVDCTFQDGGDELVSRELGANTSLKSIILNGSLQDDSFR